ncbi:hypothetical protein AVEN_208236-1 [Araneus ventricosus]|uniref:Transposase Tc1-like domain-containing protein n=1 Tax=Araneus ventricosus TaxID=182803 RepID=A0A4Y2SK08_ARAVE|nr:hypothetical protein AVEN_208236-1 [Araneus ventricosus]
MSYLKCFVYNYKIKVKKYWSIQENQLDKKPILVECLIQLQIELQTSKTLVKKQEAGATTLVHHLHGSMGRKKSEISIDIRKLTICHWKRESSERKSGEIVNVSKSTVDNIILKYKKTKSIENRPRAGLPRRFTEREERWIVRKNTCNPKTSAVKLTLKVQ